MELIFVLCALGEGDLPKFKEQVVDQDMGVAYAVTLADINGDGKLDIVVVTENPDMVFWYENPSWKRRTIAAKAPKLPVCVQPLDVDGDGKVELILGADWQPGNIKAGGSVWLLQRPENLDDPWTPIKIDEEPTMHRMRVMNADGKGKELVCSPLHGRDKKEAGSAQYLLRRPADPFKDKWTREPITNEMHITHNVWPLDWDNDGREELIVAGLEGIFVYKREGEGKWSKRQIGAGDPEKKGAGEVKVGKLFGGRRFVATVEPWHGHSAAVYTQGENPDQPWKRQVLIDKQKGGHAVWTADLMGGGYDSVVVGFRGPPEGKAGEWAVYIFHPVDFHGEKWTKQVLDDKGMGSEDLICADLNGDGKVDIVAVGRGTKNVKIYWNEGK